MFRAMALNSVLGEVGNLENATKKRNGCLTEY